MPNTTTPLAWPGRVAIALLFCALVVYGIAGRALPWAAAHLPLSAPIALFLSVALVSICWATLDVLRGRTASH
jgi:hypothetical protein